MQPPFGLTDSVTLGLIGALVTLLVVMIVQYVELRIKMMQIQTDVRKIEIATNSMKDRLVEATSVAAESRGRDQERDRAEAERHDALERRERRELE